MTNQEKLAKLIGEEEGEESTKKLQKQLAEQLRAEGYERVKVGCKKCELEPPAGEFCPIYHTGCPTESSGILKPIPELIEIAEERFVDSQDYGWVDTQRCSKKILEEGTPGYGKPFYCEWKTGLAEDSDEVAKAIGATMEEARMACAIAGMKRLQQERETNND